MQEQEDNHDPDYPLARHGGGSGSEYDASCRCTMKPVTWKAARGPTMQLYEGVEMQAPESWNVPAPDGTLLEDTCVPPVACMTAIYGINVATPRAIFLKHRRVVLHGGLVNAVQSPFEIDVEGEIDGLLVRGGVAYEVPSAPQRRPDNDEPVFLSGDGTVRIHEP